MAHLQTQIFVLLLREEAEDHSSAGTCPHAHLHPRLSGRQRPRELELDVAAAIKGELWSCLSIKDREWVFN